MSPSLRPSALPKLKECAHYSGISTGRPLPDSSPVKVSPAAERGQTLDTLYRRVLGGEAELDANNPDHVSIQWAVDMTKLIGCTLPLFNEGTGQFTADPLLWREEDLRVSALGLSGTADCCLPHVNASIDLKSGQERNYLEQQALYALGFMEKYECDNWTTHLLFSDLRKLVTHSFSRPHATDVVQGIIAKVNDPYTVPTPCEYCNWCAKKWTCNERLETVAFWAGKDPATINWREELSDPIKLGQYIDLCAIITAKDGLNDYARSLAREKLNEGHNVPGYALRNRRGSEWFEPDVITRYIDQLGAADLITAFGNLSAEKFRSLWEAKMGNAPFPSEFLKFGPSTQYVASQPKPKPTKKP